MRPGRSALLCLAFAALLLSSLPAAAQTALAPEALKTQVNGQIAELTATYKQLHQHPELSHQEVKTSAFLAAELRKTGFEVTEHVGRYADGTQAFGVVAVLKNGNGPVVMIRSDMDALPVTETTGLEYASHVRSQNPEKQDVGVMHACGHDLHMTVLLGVARELVQNKANWHGTAMLVGQPAEERIDGARAMVSDHFYERFPRPDYILAEHDTNDFSAGHIAVAAGPLLASATGVKVIFHGVSTHGSRPATGKDPIVMGAEFVMMAQTIVSRQIAAQDPSVLTIGAFHAGTKNNIIPDDAVLELSMRAFSEDARTKLLEGVKRTAAGVATAYGVAPERMPEVIVTESTVPTWNDDVLTARVRASAERVLGASNVERTNPGMGSEDVGYFGLNGKIPLTMFWLGAADPDKLDAAKKGGPALPSIHSGLFAPVYEPAIRTGVTVMSAAAMDLMKK